MILNKEVINNCRVLTMSNNRKCDYLSIDVDSKMDKTMLMGIKESNNIIDIVFIKEIRSQKFENITESIENVCYEFDINTVLIDKNGIGLFLYEHMLRNLKDISIIGISKIINNSIIDLERDIDKCNIRFMQTYECALKSYRKSFLGFSEIMNIHKETDKLINEINNIELYVDKGNIKFNIQDKEIGKLRFNCLLTYYAYKCNEKNKNENKNERKETQRRMANYEILHGMFYKYVYKAIDKEKLQIIFYHDNCGKLEKFKNIINENEFKEIRNNEIEQVIFNKANLEIYFKNGSYIKFLYASDCARGQKYHYAIIDTDLSKEVYNNVIKRQQISYYKDIKSNLETQELKDVYRIEFMDFWC